MVDLTFRAEDDDGVVIPAAAKFFTRFKLS